MATDTAKAMEFVGRDVKLSLELEVSSGGSYVYPWCGLDPQARAHTTAADKRGATGGGWHSYPLGGVESLPWGVRELVGGHP